MEPALLAAYDRPVPRYTSYPTAAQFDVSVGPAQHCEWLAGLNGKNATLYLHVPFCRQLCWYCACHTMAMRREGTLDGYAAAMSAELLLVAKATPGLVVGSIQWGGGTPTHLGAARLTALGRRIAGLFERQSGAETSMEVDPRYCDADTAAAMAAIGVTRASLGVQDFDPMVQKAINRQQSYDDTSKALKKLRTAGIRKFNIDLVYGLPLQTVDSLARTIDQALALSPDRFAVFGYAHVPWMKAHQKLINATFLPDAALRAEMADLVARRLLAGGYVRVGIDHYARPGDSLARAAEAGALRRSFQGYVADESPWVVGAGASAISSLPAGYSQNEADPALYMAAVEAGDFATVRGFAVDLDDRLRSDVIGDLMCNYATDVDELCRRHAVEPRAFLRSIPGLPRLAGDGLISVDGCHIAVTERGRPLVRFVCAAFDRHYSGAERRHSRGI